MFSICCRHQIDLWQLLQGILCNLALMVGTSDIPDWCYVESYGREGKNYFTEAPSAEHLIHLYDKSPILHVSKVRRLKANHL